MNAAAAARDRPSPTEIIEGALTVAALALVSALAIFLRSDLLANVGPVAVLFAPLLWLVVIFYLCINALHGDHGLYALIEQFPWRDAIALMSRLSGMPQGPQLSVVSPRVCIRRSYQSLRARVRINAYHFGAC